jgi:hypothetical protein
LCGVWLWVSPRFANLACREHVLRQIALGNAGQIGYGLDF